MKLYLAGKISGYSYDEVVGRIETQKALLWMYEVLSPMTGKEALRNELEFKAKDYNLAPVATNHAIFERDKWMVSSCDVVLADLTETNRVSIGTVMELAWASLLGKHTVVVMEQENIHRHAFVLEAADIVFESPDEAVQYLQVLGGQKC